jgi:pimeloyl-ACP methyl ester carboxylesterase
VGGMLALWYAAAGTERISRLVAVGEPGVALPGVGVRMPLSVLTVRGLGLAVLRSPSPRPVCRHLLAQGLGRAEVAAAPDCLIDALRLSGRPPDAKGDAARSAWRARPLARRHRDALRSSSEPTSPLSGRHHDDIPQDRAADDHL